MKHKTFTIANPDLEYLDKIKPISRIGAPRFFSLFIDRICLIIVGTVIGLFIVMLCNLFQDYQHANAITKQQRIQQERDRIYAIQKADHIPSYKITVTQI